MSCAASAYYEINALRVAHKRAGAFTNVCFWTSVMIFLKKSCYSAALYVDAKKLLKLLILS